MTIVAVGTEILVSTTNASDQMYPQITALADGGFAVTWMSHDNGSDLTFAAGCSRPTARRSAAAISWSPRRTPAIKCEPADHGAGGWRLRGDVEVVDDGSTVTFAAGCSRPTARRSTAAISWSPRRTPTVKWPADHGAGGRRLRGDVDVVDDNGSDYDIRGRVFAADGTPVNGSDFLVSTANANDQDGSADHGAGGRRLRGDVAVGRRRLRL